MSSCCWADWRCLPGQAFIPTIVSLGFWKSSRRSLAPLEVSHLPSIWQCNFYQTQIVASAFWTITIGSNHVPGLERVLVPPVPGQHGRALSFTAPLFYL